MIVRLLSSLTPWLLAVLIGIATYAGMQARHYAEQADNAEARVARAEDRAAILLEHQRWQRQQISNLGSALQTHDEQLQRDDALLDLVRQAVRDLERDDAETGDWAAQPVPAAVGDWLRTLSGDDNGAGAGDPDSAATPADATAAPQSPGDTQPGAAAAAGGL